MTLENPSVWDASYQHPAYYDRSAMRLVVYMWRRPNDKANATAASRWTTVPERRRLGDAREFVTAANSRTRELREDARARGKILAKNKALWACSFVHLLLSPANRRELSDADLRQLAAPWIRGAEGRTLPHVGAVHREGGGHLHLAVVRDKFAKAELAALKRHSEGLAMDLGLRRERRLEHQGLGQTLTTAMGGGIDGLHATSLGR